MREAGWDSGGLFAACCRAWQPPYTRFVGAEATDDDGASAFFCTLGRAALGFRFAFAGLATLLVEVRPSLASRSFLRFR